MKKHEIENEHTPIEEHMHKIENEHMSIKMIEHEHMPIEVRALKTHDISVDPKHQERVP